MGPAGTEVGRMVMAVSMDSFAMIMRMESTSLVSSIMAVTAAMGSCITRTGQSRVKWTTK